MTQATDSPLSTGGRGSSASFVLQTERLLLREITTSDADFLLTLLNDPSFLRYIGDKGIRTLEGAQQYAQDGPIASYAKYGFGLYLVILKETGESMGICGLVKRESLPDVDLGFAFLPQYWNRGYALESAGAVMKRAKEVLRIDRIVAITDPDNDASAKLLQKLGLNFSKMIRLSEAGPEIKLFAPDSDDDGESKSG